MGALCCGMGSPLPVELSEEEKLQAAAAAEKQRAEAVAAGRSLLVRLPTPNKDLEPTREQYYRDGSAIWRCARGGDAESLKAEVEKWAGNAKVLEWTNPDPTGKHKTRLVWCGPLVAATKLGYRTDVESGAPNPEPILSVLKVLLSAGANIDARDRFGATALMMAVMNNHPTWCRLLIDEGAYVNAKNNDGKMAMGYADAGTAPEITAMLQAAGAVGSGVV
jgi:hypothetical protein